MKKPTKQKRRKANRKSQPKYKAIGWVFHTGGYKLVTPYYKEAREGGTPVRVYVRQS